ncbi:MAG: MBL fold metallo-hydrolase [Bacteroidota bacterium]
MKLTFWGAARQVTGSMYLLELADDYRVLIDCGTDMDRKLYDEKEETIKSEFGFFPFDATQINLVVLTHAHIDHSGNIPMLYQAGFEGQVLCTTATYELAELLLYDSAHLHAKRLKAAQGDTKKSKKKMDHLQKRGDFYLEKQVKDSLENFVTLQFNRKFKVIEGLNVTFIPAGHLLGAAHVIFDIYENGEKKSICFSGDLGRFNYPLHVDPEPVPACDYLICETTYGGRKHEDEMMPEDALADVIQRTCIDIPGRMIVPSFSVGRTQTLLYTLNRLYTERGFTPIKVFSDSPLAKASTRVYQRNIGLLNKEAKDYQKENESLFDFENLQYVVSEKESKAIDNYNEPCIIVSSSGMVQGGRVEYHIAQNIGNTYCTILMIGYASEGTLGNRLMNGQKTINIKGKEVEVKANIEKIDVFSGHADQDGLLKFVNYQSKEKLKNIFLVHGESSSMDVFKELLQNEGYSSVTIPLRGQSFEL